MALNAREISTTRTLCRRPWLRSWLSPAFRLQNGVFETREVLWARG